MGLEHYLNELLYRYNCVIIPGLGAFLTQKKSAVLHKATHTFYPPTKTISFNEQLTTNDGLLVSYMADAEKIGYEPMLRRVIKSAGEWKAKLLKGERLTLPNIGELWLNDTGKIQFQPSEQVNYLTSSFGLSSFVSTPIIREELEKEVAALEEKIPLFISPQLRKEHSFRPYLKYAAILLLAFSTGVTGFRAYQQGVDKQQIVREDAQQQVSRHIQEATFFDAVPMELPTLTLEAGSKSPMLRVHSQKIHHIIAGVFRFKNNAEKKIRQLKRQGFEATYLGTNEHGLHMVTYKSFVDASEALRALREIKRTQSSDAWLKSIR